MRLGTTKEYNKLYNASAELHSTINFYCGDDELCVNAIEKQTRIFLKEYLAWLESVKEEHNG